MVSLGNRRASRLLMSGVPDLLNHQGNEGAEAQPTLPATLLAEQDKPASKKSGTEEHPAAQNTLASSLNRRRGSQSLMRSAARSLGNNLPSSSEQTTSSTTRSNYTKDANTTSTTSSTFIDEQPPQPNINKRRGSKFPMRSPARSLAANNLNNTGGGDQDSAASLVDPKNGEHVGPAPNMTKRRGSKMVSRGGGGITSTTASCSSPIVSASGMVPSSGPVRLVRLWNSTKLATF
ncbi:unnamed protein product [Amoebophrya sp. A25]|nr:unnamed protein product [Amoebophrya sp. A25]|eukprot:GSA25T00008602001.1